MLVKEENAIPLEIDASWDIVGALPEMLQTSYGSLTKGLQLKKGEKLLIRGGSSTVGLMAIVVAKMMGASVIATTRSKEKLATLAEYGANAAILDNDSLVEQVSKCAPDGVDKVLELVGFTTLFQDMSLLRQGGYLCFTGALAGEWTLADFSPFSIPSGKYLTSYAGEARDLPAAVISKVLAAVVDRQIKIPIAQVYHGLVEVGKAQKNLESGKCVGKHVVVLD